MTGYLKPSGGSIKFEGQEIGGLAPYKVCRLGVGRTFQIVRPFQEMTVEDNVMTGALFSSPERISVAEGRKRAEQPLRLTGLWDLRNMLAGALTIGQKKKLELARSLAVQPKFLLLDEVMGGVAKREVDELIGVLRRIHATGVTIMMIEHVIEAILELAQHVVVLNFGKKLFEGAPREVIEHPAVIESYLGRPLDIQ
jgi:branched-chain amino acid transport system ATP-binding protein